MQSKFPHQLVNLFSIKSLGHSQTSAILLVVVFIVNACLEVHHSLRAKVHQFKTYF